MLREDTSVEPWLRGTRHDVPPVPRAVLHALDLTREDFQRWVWPLAPELVLQQPYNLPSLAFQARHISRSLDRLLTYAEGNPLSEMQRSLLANEHAGEDVEALRQEFERSLETAAERIAALPLRQIGDTRYVGTAKLPVTLAGLLTHIADHTQRHSGQAVTTAKLLIALHGLR